MADQRASRNAKRFDERRNVVAPFETRYMVSIAGDIGEAESDEIGRQHSEILGESGNDVVPGGPGVDCQRRTVQKNDDRPAAGFEIARADTARHDIAFFDCHRGSLYYAIVEIGRASCRERVCPYV